MRLVPLASVAVCFGVVQAIVGSLALAWLHRDLLLAPYRFFPVHLYDAFVKVWFLAAEHAPLPPLLQHFRAQGLAAKLAIAPELLAINVAVAVVVAVVLGPFAGRSVPVERQGRRTLVLIVATCFVVHVAAWAAAFQAPEALTPVRLARAVARDLLQGGALVALAVLAVSAGLTSLLLRTRSGAAVAFAAALAAAGPSALGPATEADAKVAESAPGAEGAGRYNVVLVSIDSLRADHLGAWGYSKATSPAIDEVARRGVVFRNHASTTSWTLPAHMSLLTGRSILGHGVVGDDRSLPDSVGTVAESFSKGGWETHAIVSAPYVHSRYGFARGFDDYDDRTVHFETNEDSYRSVTAPRLLDATERFLARERDRPFFLFLHFWDVHYDYAPGPPYDTMFDPDYRGGVDGENFYFDPAIRDGMDARDLEHLVALYDGEIRLVDDHLARLGRALEKLGIADRTIVAITADHGDEFFEHGNKGHHRTLYQEVLHVPWVLTVPGRTPSRSDFAGETSLIDVGPTLLGLVGLGAAPGTEGRDFSGLWTGAALPPEAPVWAELYRTGTRNVQVAEIDARRKLIHHFQNRSVEAYDLGADSGEKTSLAASGDVAVPLVEGLREWIDRRWQRFDQRVRSEGVRPVVLDEKETEQLRSLGYLQ